MGKHLLPNLKMAKRDDLSSRDELIRKEDPVHRLVMEVLSKKPVNSEHFTVIKRIKPRERASPSDRKGPKPDPDTVTERAGQLLHQLGFAYGRLNPVDPTQESKKGVLRIRAPGPQMHDEEANVTIPKVRTLKVPERRPFFARPLPPSKPRTTSVRQRVRTAAEQPTRLTTSQVQARELLGHLDLVSPVQKKFVGTEVKKKLQTLKLNIEKGVRAEEELYNQKGIFSTEVNHARARASFAARLKARTAAGVRQYAKQAEQEFKQLRVQSESEVSESSIDNSEQFLRIVESTIAKDVIRNHRTEKVREEAKNV